MGAANLPAVWTVKVVGLTFVPGYPRNLYALAGAFERTRSTSAPTVVDLVRNPANPHDTNAIEVHVPALGDAAMIGHLPRPVAARLAPAIDRGDTWNARVLSVLIDPDHEDKPGISIEVERIPVHAPVNAASLI